MQSNLLNAKQSRVKHHTRLSPLRDDRHVWTDRNSLTGIDKHWVKRKISKAFLYKLHLKCIKYV